MRLLPVSVFALASAALLIGCAEPTTPTKAAKSAGNEEVTLKIAHATEAGGDFGASERLYRQAVTLAPEVVATHVELGEFYHRHRREAEATAALNEALRLDPKNTDVMRRLANIDINKGVPARALALLNDAVAIDGKNAYLYNSRGVACDLLGNYAQAQQNYRTAISLDPEHVMTFNANLSMSYILSGNYNAAIALLLPLLDMPDVTPTIRQNLAMAYGLKGDSARAMKLALKDMPEAQAKENLRFYRMIAGKPAASGGRKQAASPVPLSVVNEIFPENTPPQPSAPLPAKSAETTVHKVAVRVIAPLPAVSAPVPAPLPATAPVALVKTPPPVIPPAPAPAAATQASAVPSPELTMLPAIAPAAGWVLPAPVLKPPE